MLDWQNLMTNQMEVRAEGGLGGGLEGGPTWLREPPQVAAQCYLQGQGGL